VQACPRLPCAYRCNPDSLVPLCGPDSFCFCDPYPIQQSQRTNQRSRGRQRLCSEFLRLVSTSSLVPRILVLIITSEDTLVGGGSHSCCNMTAYMDDIKISEYCVGYYYTLPNRYNRPFAEEKFTWPRSPAVSYRPSVPNPMLTFTVVCPEYPGTGVPIQVNNPFISSVSLVPRCTCQEEDTFQSLKSQPCNAALNGNFANFDLTQENPVSGWTSQESWRGQVLPVPYIGPYGANDNSNNGSV
jgi:hypothetical protein